MSYNTKRELYLASKIIFRFCLAALAIYLLVSILFYFIGQDQFQDLQAGILSHPIAYIIPVLLLLSLAGTYLFKVGDEEDEPQIFQARRTGHKNVSRFYPTVLGVLLMAVVIYIFGFKRLDHENYVAASKGGRSIVPAKPSETAAGARVENNDKSLPEISAKQVAKKPVKDSEIIPPTSVVDEHISKKPLDIKDQYTSVELKYKVASKAYLYDAPDKDTRRNAFISANSSYNPLLPKGEKNGFVYVVFTNEQGETTMGWLNKKDLRPVNEVVYNYSK